MPIKEEKVMVYSYLYPRPAVTVDGVIFTFTKKILLIKRKNNPFENHWALPGGFINMDETALQSTQRELEEETGITWIKLELFSCTTSYSYEKHWKEKTFIWTIKNDREIKNREKDIFKWFTFVKLEDFFQKSGSALSRLFQSCADS